MLKHSLPPCMSGSFTTLFRTVGGGSPSACSLVRLPAAAASKHISPFNSAVGEVVVSSGFGRMGGCGSARIRRMRDWTLVRHFSPSNCPSSCSPSRTLHSLQGWRSSTTLSFTDTAKLRFLLTLITLRSSGEQFLFDPMDNYLFDTQWEPEVFHDYAYVKKAISFCCHYGIS